MNEWITKTAENSAFTPQMEEKEDGEKGPASQTASLSQS